jgi:BirA family biotin operon repressor/biotin-[acetyl-CoA-carboxylase] ligase
MSIILRPRAPGSEAPLFGLLAAVAAASALDAGIKWPNDLIVSGKKVAGILTEARSNQQGIRDLVIGIGVNLNQETGDFPPEIRSTATSLRMARGKPIESVNAAGAILAELGRWYTLWSRVGRDPVLERFRTLTGDLVGRRVRVQDGGTVRTGVTDGISHDGALRIRPDDDGSHEDVLEIRFGDVIRIEEA